jgi:hypothetical protein
MTRSRGGVTVGRVFTDCVRERQAPFSPESVAEEFAKTLLAYGVTTVTGDRFGGLWPREALRKFGVAYQPSEKTKSELYSECLPMMNSGAVELLDYPKLVAQLCSLERRVSRAGKDSIDHPPNGHDDVANAVAGALWLARSKAEVSFAGWNFGVEDMIRENPWHMEASQDYRG